VGSEIDLDASDIKEFQDERTKLSERGEAATLLRELYVSYRKKYNLCVNGSVFTHRKQNQDGSKSDRTLSNREIYAHICRKFAVAIFAGPQSSKFMCFDVDEDDQDAVRKIIASLVRFGIPDDRIYVSLSGGKGYHVEIFFEELVYTEKLRTLYEWVTQENDLDRSKVEFRPTHNQCIKLPLSIHHKTGNICWFVDRVTFEPIEDIMYLRSIQKIDFRSMYDAVDELKLNLKPQIHCRNNVEQSINSEDRMICEEVDCGKLPIIINEGTRNHLMVFIAATQRREGAERDVCTAVLKQWYHDQDHDLIKSTEEEVLKDINRIVNWAYGEKFEVFDTKAPRRNSITAREALYTLLPSTKSMRKLMLVLMYNCLVYGRCTMTYDRLCAITGVGRCTAVQSMQSLEDEGFIKIKHNPIKHVDGAFVGAANTYVVCEDKLRDHMTQRTDISDDILVDTGPTSGPTPAGILKTAIPINFTALYGDFDKTYYNSLASMLPVEILAQYLTKGEMKTVKKTRAARSKKIADSARAGKARREMMMAEAKRLAKEREEKEAWEKMWPKKATEDIAVQAQQILTGRNLNAGQSV